jgi:hypothetical protein
MGNPRLVLVVVSLVSAVFTPGRLSAQIYETVGTRAQGMGGAFVAVADDATATWWNPAGLILSYFSLVSDRSETTEPADGPAYGPAWRSRTNAFAASYPALGVSYYRLRISEIAPQLTTADGQPVRQDIGAAGIGLGSRVSHQFGVTLGQSLGNHLVIASSLRLVRMGHTELIAPGGATLEDADELEMPLDTGGDVDVGVMAMMGSARVGFSVKHLNEPEFGEGDVLVLKRQMRAGIAWIAGQPGAPGRLTAAFDADLTRTPTAFGEARHMAAGAELLLRQQVAFRGGVSANMLGDVTMSTSAGISIAVSRGFFLDGAATFGSDRARKGWAVGLRLTI